MAAWLLLVLFAQTWGQEHVDPTPEVYEPTWYYKCIPDEGCRRTERLVKEDGNATQARVSLYKSLDLCRTVCGRFGGLWPRPLTAALSTQTVQFHPLYLRYDMSNVAAEARDLVVRMSHVISQNLMAECGGNVTELVSTPVVVYINCNNPSTAFGWDVDESYSLDVQSRQDGNITVIVTAGSVYGVRHGLESFTQLVASDRAELSARGRCGLRVVAGAKIRDRPVFKHRGFLLDTSRNFIPMRDIKRTIDGMAAAKMNVFHWHVTDSHSFPLESTRVPYFTRYGAYSKDEIYTAEEVRSLVTYAQARGVRLVIEIDSPAHAANGWQWGKEHNLGDLAVCVNEQSWRHNCIEPPCGQLNPTNPNMYNVLKDLYRDVAEYLPSPPLFHMGGDEVVFSCWNNTKEIREYMEEKGMPLTKEGYTRLWANFHAKALHAWDEVLADMGLDKQPVMLWSSALTDVDIVQKYLDKSRYVIIVWEQVESPLLAQLIKFGYRVIAAPKNVWYLDHGFWGVTKYSNWRKMYAYRLVNSGSVLGGEVAMWSEYLDTNALDARVWPRTAAAAERLWADPNTSAAAAEPRLQRLRARLLARGLRPDAISPAWCTQHDTSCL